MIRESLSAVYFRVFAKRKESRLNTPYCIYKKNTIAGQY